jgi:hypothetical protein
MSQPAPSCRGGGEAPPSTQWVLGTGALAGHEFAICPVCGFSTRVVDGVLVDHRGRPDRV